MSSAISVLEPSRAKSPEVLGLADPLITGMYDPVQHKVGCVLIQAAFRCDGRASRIFDTSDWFLAPTPDMVRVTAPASQWETIAGMTPDQRESALRAVAKPTAEPGPSTGRLGNSNSEAPKAPQ